MDLWMTSVYFVLYGKWKSPSHQTVMSLTRGGSTVCDLNNSDFTGVKFLHHTRLRAEDASDYRWSVIKPPACPVVTRELLSPKPWPRFLFFVPQHVKPDIKDQVDISQMFPDNYFISAKTPSIHQGQCDLESIACEYYIPKMLWRESSHLPQKIMW